MKKFAIISFVFFISWATVGQTVSTVSWIISNFDKDEGIVSHGVLTGPWAGKFEPPEYYIFTDDGGSSKIRAGFGDEGGGGKLLTVPDYNQIITIGAIMDFSENNNRVLQVKYWHYGENSIIEELGITTVDQINNNPPDDLPFVLAGQFTGPGSSTSKHYFEDQTGQLELRLLNMNDPPYNVDIYGFGVIDNWWPTYEVYYYEEANFTAIPENISNQVSIHPNPAKGTVYIETSANTENIQLIDFAGQYIFEQKASGNQIVVNISDLEPGIYLVKVFSHYNVITRKLVID